MKKIYTILAGSFMSLLSFAGNGYDDGKLSITYAGNDDIRISVDGREYTDRDNTVMIDNLRPGYHTIKVYKKRSRNGWDIFGGNKNRDKVLYSNSMYIKSRTFVDVMGRVCLLWPGRSGRASTSRACGISSPPVDR